MGSRLFQVSLALKLSRAVGALRRRYSARRRSTSSVTIAESASAESGGASHAGTKRSPSIRNQARRFAFAVVQALTGFLSQ